MKTHQLEFPRYLNKGCYCNNNNNPSQAVVIICCKWLFLHCRCFRVMVWRRELLFSTISRWTPRFLSLRVRLIFLLLWTLHWFRDWKVGIIVSHLYVVSAMVGCYASTTTSLFFFPFYDIWCLEFAVQFIFIKRFKCVAMKPLIIYRNHQTDLCFFLDTKEMIWWIKECRLIYFVTYGHL